VDKGDATAPTRGSNRFGLLPSAVRKLVAPAQRRWDQADLAAQDETENGEGMDRHGRPTGISGENVARDAEGEELDAGRAV